MYPGLASTTTVPAAQRAQVAAQEAQAGPGGQQHPVARLGAGGQPVRDLAGAGRQPGVGQRLAVHGDGHPVREPARRLGRQVHDGRRAQLVDQRVQPARPPWAGRDASASPPGSTAPPTTTGRRPSPAHRPSPGPAGRTQPARLRPGQPPTAARPTARLRPSRPLSRSVRPPVTGAPRAGMAPPARPGWRRARPAAGRAGRRPPRPAWPRRVPRPPGRPVAWPARRRPARDRRRPG